MADLNPTVFQVAHPLIDVAGKRVVGDIVVKLVSIAVLPGLREDIEALEGRLHLAWFAH